VGWGCRSWETEEEASGGGAWRYWGGGGGVRGKGGLDGQRLGSGGRKEEDLFVELEFGGTA
jgi:hypothetical protein